MDPAPLTVVTEPAGLTWAPIRADDLDELSALLARIETADDPPERHSRDELAESYAGHGFDADRDTRLGRLDGRVVAYGWNHPRHDDVDPRRVHLAGGVDPAHRRRGLGRSLLSWQLGQAAEFHRLTQAAGHGPLLVFSDVGEEVVGQHRLFEAYGLRLERRFTYLTLRFAGPVPRPSPPGPIRLVPWTRELIEPVRLVHNEAFADHWLSQPVDATRWAEQLHRKAVRLDWSWVAIDGDSAQLVGYVINTVYEQNWAVRGFSEGWTDRLGVLRPWRGRGIATALLARSMQSFVDGGVEAAGLDVDTANATGALALYEHLGYRRRSTVAIYARTI